MTLAEELRAEEAELGERDFAAVMEVARRRLVREGRAADALSSVNEFGRCFAFRGSEGKLTVRLSRPVRPTHFSVEHLHAALCDPARNANCSSAPQQMEVVGRSGDGDLVEFGSFSYAASSDAPKRCKPK